MTRSSARPHGSGRVRVRRGRRRGAHGTGLGHRLHEAALGDIPTVLRVLEGNERAVRFYRGHGYAPVGDPEPIGGAWGDAREQLMVRP